MKTSTLSHSCEEDKKQSVQIEHIKENEYYRSVNIRKAEIKRDKLCITYEFTANKKMNIIQLKGEEYIFSRFYQDKNGNMLALSIYNENIIFNKDKKFRLTLEIPKPGNIKKGDSLHFFIINDDKDFDCLCKGCEDEFFQFGDVANIQEVITTDCNGNKEPRTTNNGGVLPITEIYP